MSLGTVIAIRHVQFEHLGTLAVGLREHGWRSHYLDAGVDDLRCVNALAPDLMVILGGPLGVYEAKHYPYLRDTLHLIEQRLAAARPLLGICLGAQLIAHALGSRVYPAPAKELGWSPLQLTAAGVTSCLNKLALCNYQVLHWHGDTFDLPAGAEHLAATERTPNQAFSYGDAVLGLQFHLEIDGAEIERWLIGHACEIASVPDVTPEILRADTARYAPALAHSAAAVLKQWLAGLALSEPAATPC